MASLRDIFGNSFVHERSNNGNGNTGDNSNMPNSGSNQQNRESGVATNLTETNNGIARQSDLVDEVIALKQQQSYPESHHRNFLNAFTNTNKPESTLTDEILMDLTRNVNKLTMTERQEAQNEVYGIAAKNSTEDPWELNMWMNDMDDVIKREISGNDKRFSALRLTMHTQGENNNGLGPSMSGVEYVRSQKLKFLRASDWVIEDAVVRMAQFFELKLEYFGSGPLIRDLTMKDLTQEDINLWKQYGFLQLSHDQDTNGRAILILVTRQQLHLPHATVIRCLLYLSSVMARDESIQLCGSVQLFWGLGHQFTISARASAIIQAYACIPVRAVARHFCKDNTGVQDMFGLIAKGMKAFEAIRFKGHTGTAMECCYNLMTYGIPRTAIPIDNEGEVELAFHINFLKTMERKEADEETRQRQERLDKQIQMVLNSSMATISSGRQLSSDGRGGPYQREPPMWFDEGAQGSDRSSLLSWSMAGMSSMDPYSIRTEEMDGLPDDFMKQIGSGRSDVTMASANHGLHHYSPNRIQPIEAPIVTSAPMLSPMSTERQSERKKDDLILVPAMYDVIMGRGRHNKKKPGNRKLNDLLEAYQEEYERSDKFQKTVLSEVVVSKMIEGGSRFLVREGDKKHGMWVEVSLEKARDKVSHDFRNLRRSAKAAQTTNAAVDAPPAGGLPAMPSTKDGSVKRQRSLGNTSEGQGSIKRVGKFD